MSEQSWRIDPRWLKHANMHAVDLIDAINDNYGFHAFGVTSLVPFEPDIEPDTRLQAVIDSHTELEMQLHRKGYARIVLSVEQNMIRQKDVRSKEDEDG